MKKIPIIPVNYGIASVYPGEAIEINHKLSGSLKDKILKHELRHSHQTNYTKQDFKNDFQSKGSYFMESVKFAINNPEAWINFFPIMYSYYFKRWTWNTAGVFPFLYFGSIFSVFCWLFLGINIVVSGALFTLFYTYINLIFLLGTYRIVRKDRDFVYVAYYLR